MKEKESFIKSISCWQVAALAAATVAFGFFLTSSGPKSRAVKVMLDDPYLFCLYASIKENINDGSDSQLIAARIACESFEKNYVEEKPELAPEEEVVANGDSDEEV